MIISAAEFWCVVIIVSICILGAAKVAYCRGYGDGAMDTQKAMRSWTWQRVQEMLDERKRNGE